ncbi:hypothetical protein KSP39_PZI008973 [Platanthera zijinensis]|uniref:U-box domain-containing protein n=1 Tax=Platanthera zijinensis TaxID=2320716 RepID=A0AAP0BMN1_9ASPA
MEVKGRTACSLVKRMSHPGNAEALGEIIAEIRLLTKHDAEVRLLLADAGAVSLLAHHLLASSPIATPSSLENASAALLNISISAREPLMSTPGFLDALAHCISPAASADVAQNIAAVVFSLLSVDAYRPIVGSKKTLLSALIALIAAPDPDARTVKDVLRALFGVGLYALNRATMVDLGVVRPLFSLVTEDSRPGVAEDALAVIAKVAGCWESLQDFRNESGIRILVNLVDRKTGASRRARENAVAALLNLAMSGGDAAVAEIRQLEEAEAVVKELVENEISARATSKAVALLNALERRRRNPVESHWIRDFDLLDISTSHTSSEWTSN